MSAKGSWGKLNHIGFYSIIWGIPPTPLHTTDWPDHLSVTSGCIPGMQITTCVPSRRRMTMKKMMMKTIVLMCGPFQWTRYHTCYWWPLDVKSMNHIPFTFPSSSRLAVDYYSNNSKQQQPLWFTIWGGRCFIFNLQRHNRIHTYRERNHTSVMWYMVSWRAHLNFGWAGSTLR